MLVDLVPLLATNLTSTGCCLNINNNIKNEDISLNGLTINDNLQLKKKIGAGTYGLIYLVEDIITKQVYAAKIVLKDSSLIRCSTKDSKFRKSIVLKRVHDYFKAHNHVKATELDLEDIKNSGNDIPYLKEVSLHLRVHEHQNIVSIHKVFNLDDLAVVILMDYYEQGDLFKNILEDQIFVNPPEYQNRILLMKNAMLQLVEAVRHCHSKGISHCDLKPENVMVRYNPKYRRTNFKNIVDYNEIHIALIDFGLAMDSETICCNACRGSSFYMAPERVINFQTNPFIWYFVDLSQYKEIANIKGDKDLYFPTKAGDKWSLGVLLINITCSMNPWTIASPSKNSGNLVFRTYLLHNKSILQTILPISHQFNDLLNQVFMIDPNDRIDLEKLETEIVTCDFFNNRPPAPNYLHSPPYTDSELEKSEDLMTKEK